MKNTYLLPLGIITSILISGCGGSTTTSTTVTGQFVDTFVSGLNYTCSSGTTGTTNNDGEYTCNTGDTVEFFLGSYSLGSATASAGIVTPETMYPDNPTAELNIARLLQTLDNDSTDGIITIPDNYSDLDAITATPETATFISIIESTVGTLVTEVAAQSHLDEAELTVGIKGNTKYYRNSQGAIGNRTYASDGTYTGTYQENDVSGTYTIKDNTLTILRTSGSSDVNIVLTFLKTVNNVLNFNISVNGGDTFQTYSYPSEALRQAALEDAIVGKTKYYKNSKGAIGSRTYASDGTYTGTFQGDSVNGTYTIKDNVITIIRTSGSSDVNLKLTYIDTINEVLSFDISVNGGDTFETSSYSTEAARDAS